MIVARRSKNLMILFTKYKLRLIFKYFYACLHAYLNIWLIKELKINAIGNKR